MDLDNSQIRQSIVETLSIEIDDWSESRYDENHRSHLGASIIGKVCERQLWYNFRWAKKDKIDGQTRRLFERGRREEQPVFEFLRGIGCEVQDRDPTTDKQWQVSAVDSHFGGSMDARIKLPAKFEIDEWIVCEVKTMNDSQFNRMVKEKVKVNKPEYWAQMNVYGYLSEPKMQYALFVAVNKNNDEIHFELLKLDFDLAIDYVNRARNIITTVEAPPKAALSPANFICKFCNFKDICHYSEAVEKNCRSCRHSSPTNDGQWICNKFGGDLIPLEFLSKGCDSHSGIR